MLSARSGGGGAQGRAVPRPAGGALRSGGGWVRNSAQTDGPARDGPARGEARRGLRAATETETGEARARLPASASGAPGGRGRNTARARVLRRERRRGRGRGRWGLRPRGSPGQPWGQPAAGARAGGGQSQSGRGADVPRRGSVRAAWRPGRAGPGKPLPRGDRPQHKKKGVGK